MAAVTLALGEPFKVQRRDTPKPGPGDLLVAVKSVAINPADAIMRDNGLFVSTIPTVLGFDVSGIVMETGANVPTESTGDSTRPSFRPGSTRIAAYSAAVWRSSNPDYGIFQEMCLIPWQHATVIPNDMTWNHAATLPVSVQVPVSAWDAMQIPRLGEALGKADNDAESKDLFKKEALLIWGASSSVGSMGVQIAKLLREDPNSAFGAVYATAGPANLPYVQSLGADRVFDYKDPGVVDAIVSAARADGLAIRHCFLAIGQLAQCQAVLKEFVEKGSIEYSGKIASAPPLPENAEVVEGLETIFVMPSGDEEVRLEHFRYWISAWLTENLAKGAVKPSPEPWVVGKGVDAVNAAVDEILRGVSCKKLVVEIAE